MKNYRLYLVRHGVTQGNLDGIYMGSGTTAWPAWAAAIPRRKAAARWEWPCRQGSPTSAAT